MNPTLHKEVFVSVRFEDKLRSLARFAFSQSIRGMVISDNQKGTDYKLTTEPGKSRQCVVLPQGKKADLQSDSEYISRLPFSVGLFESLLVNSLSDPEAYTKLQSTLEKILGHALLAQEVIDAEYEQTPSSTLVESFIPPQLSVLLNKINDDLENLAHQPVRIGDMNNEQIKKILMSQGLHILIGNAPGYVLRLESKKEDDYAFPIISETFRIDCPTPHEVIPLNTIQSENPVEDDEDTTHRFMMYQRKSLLTLERIAFEMFRQSRNGRDLFVLHLAKNDQY